MLENRVRFVCVSDTHGQLEEILGKIPNGDVLLHSGDFTNYGYPAEVKAFNESLGKLPHPTKIVIGGNHDLCLDEEHMSLFHNFRSICRSFSSRSVGLSSSNCRNLLTNCRYLEDSGVRVHGYNIYGCPWFTESGRLFPAFKRPASFVMEKWRAIPFDTDILLTHSPSRDGEGLSEIIQKNLTNLKLHVSGHYHRGTRKTESGNYTCIDAAICDGLFRPVYEPVVFSLPKID